MIYIAGNGGLASEAEHFAAELTGKFAYDIYVPCMALTANSAQLTALTNDIGWENVYSHLIEVFGKEGDTFIGLTTSKAQNIINACEKARQMGLNVVQLDSDSLIGETGVQKQEYAINYLHKLAEEIKIARIQG